MPHMPEETTVHPYDRLYGSLHNVSLSTKATTIQHVEPVTGRSVSFIVQTFRHEDGDHVFIQIANGEGNTRVYLPPKVTACVGSQHHTLTRKNRSRASRRSAQDQMAAGTWKGFKKK
jgi:hypothetical protein